MRAMKTTEFVTKRALSQIYVEERHWSFYYLGERLDESGIKTALRKLEHEHVKTSDILKVLEKKQKECGLLFVFYFLAHLFMK